MSTPLYIPHRHGIAAPVLLRHHIATIGRASSQVYLKLEMQNPGGSVKDRIALSMIEEAEKRGDIDPARTTIVEATSGNTGIGLAMVAAAKGYKCIIVMPQVPSMYERYILVRKFGCDVHLTSVMQDNFPKTIENLIGYSTELVKKNPDYWTPSQFDSEDNPLAHLTGTGPEIWEQTDGEVDCFVAGAGTGGTLNGAGQYLKSKKPSCRVVCVEPTEARVLVGAPGGMHGVVGIGANLQLPLIEKLAPGQEPTQMTPSPTPRPLLIFFLARAGVGRGAAGRNRRVCARVDARVMRVGQPRRRAGGVPTHGGGV